MVGVLLVLVTVVHWMTPTGAIHLHTLHLVMRKMFLLPVLLAAVWFGLRGALLSAAATTVLYLPHVAYQWVGRVTENVNQLGEIVSIWLVAGVAGLLVARVRKARHTALEPYRSRLDSLVEALDHQLSRLGPDDGSGNAKKEQ